VRTFGSEIRVDLVEAREPIDGSNSSSESLGHCVHLGLQLAAALVEPMLLILDLVNLSASTERARARDHRQPPAEKKEIAARPS